jgi:hypothetical protein
VGDVSERELERLGDRALSALTEDERNRFVVYLDGEVRPAGATLALGEHQIVVDTPTAVAFVDELPGANWMHACRYLLLDAEGSTVRSVAATRPPSFGRLPPSWSVISKPAAVAGWRLLPLSDSKGGKP